MLAIWLKVLGILIVSAVIGIIFGRAAFRYRRTKDFPDVPEDEIYFMILRYGRRKTA